MVTHDVSLEHRFDLGEDANRQRIHAYECVARGAEQINVDRSR